MADSGVHTLVPLMQTAETPDNYKVKKKQPRRSSGLQRRNNKALWGVRAAARHGEDRKHQLASPSPQVWRSSVQKEFSGV